MNAQLDLFGPPVSPAASPEPAPLPVVDVARLDAVADQHAPNMTLPADLAEALGYFDDAVCDRKDRAQVRSSLNTISRVLGRPLAQIPASPELLRPMLASATPARVGVKPRNWSQVRSRALGALRSLGVDIVPSRATTTLTPEWLTLSAALPTRRLQTGLSRFLHFLSRMGLTADQVAPESFEAFRAELVCRSLVSNPEQCLRRTARLWNEAAAGAVGWPKVVFQADADPRRYSLEWCAFPPSFVAEVDAFIAAKSNTDPLAEEGDYSRPTRTATAEGRRGSLRLIASGLVHSGAVRLDQVTGLAVLADERNAKAALRHMRATRSGGQLTASHVNHAYLLRTIAVHWLKDDQAADKLKRLIADLNVHRQADASTGITPKNRERLRQFDLPANIDALISLPNRVLRTVSSVSEPSYRDSVRVMYALQVGLLTFVPIRSKNLMELKLRANLIDMGKGSKRSVRIHLPAKLTKTYQDYEAPVPAHLFELLDSWITYHRQRVCPTATDLLFPNPRGEERSRDAMALKLKRFIDRETGLIINPHLFRHIAAKLYLDQHPEGIEIVRQLLGHRAWAARSWLNRRARQVIAAENIGLAVNSVPGRTQDELHIHLDCLRPSVRRAVDHDLPDVGEAWAELATPLTHGHRYRTRWLAESALATTDPFRLLAADPAVGEDRSCWTLVMVAAHWPSGEHGFVLLSHRADLGARDLAAGEELLDHRCTGLTNAARP